MVRFGRQASPVHEYIVGVDESGTGAFAGPFTVTAFMSRVSHTGWIAAIGARDSKVLSHQRRLELREELAPAAVIAQTIAVPGDYLLQKQAWRKAVAKAVVHCLGGIEWAADKVLIQIDGALDPSLQQYFTSVWQTRAQFVVKGDAHVPQISAASIYAKTIRSELMYEAHQRYPMYGWSNATGHGNDGYGTADHLRAIKKYGICELHRRVRPLLPYFVGG